MNPKFRITVLTYNRASTLENNLPFYKALRSDVLQVVDNGSDDLTNEVLGAFESSASENCSIDITRNPRNLGFARSFVKAVFMTSEDYHMFLSDEDMPAEHFLDTYREAIQRFGRYGVVARGNPYPKVWSIDELDKSEIVHDDENFTVFRPGLYAAHLASYQSVYMGGICFNTEAIKNSHLVKFEQGSYPQRLFAMDAAFNGGLILVKHKNLGQFPGAHASVKREAMTPRKGDWGIAEYLSAAKLLLHFYGRGDMSEAAFAELSERQLRFAYSRAAIYFTKCADKGEDAALHFLESVMHSSDVLERPLFWRYFYDHFNANFSEEHKKMFRNCSLKLEAQFLERDKPENNEYLHFHLGFGTVPINQLD